ncbi:hypothetical protein [Thermogymnomonas acidicola]|uniref:hypothetical protein n=1 Tax=Thermogymnomonas acidicola TaxID=399579 RepID=UPI0014942306|nr:hypothetical protein [Thermogymnomonas acidicola]
MNTMETGGVEPLTDTVLDEEEVVNPGGTKTLYWYVPGSTENTTGDPPQLTMPLKDTEKAMPDGKPVSSKDTEYAPVMKMIVGRITELPCTVNDPNSLVE